MCYVMFLTECSDGNVGIHPFLEESLIDVGRCGLDLLPVNETRRMGMKRMKQTHLPILARSFITAKA